MSFRVSDRVTRVIYTSYAVDMQTGRFTRWKPDSSPAAWYVIRLFHRKFAQDANFL